MGKDFDFTAEWSCSFKFAFYEKKEIISIDSNKTKTLPKPLAKALRTQASTASTKSNSSKNHHQLQYQLLLEFKYHVFHTHYLQIILRGVTSCRHFWQLLQAVDSFGRCYKLSTGLTAVKSW